MEDLKYILSLWRFAVALVLVASLAWLIHRYLPAQHNPLRPLALDDPIGLATYRKFTNLKYEPATCLQALKDVSLTYTPVADKETGAHCGFKNAVSLGRLQTPLNDQLSMTCPLAAALYTWENSAARPLAQDLLDSPLARIETYGTYSCRNIAGTSSRSQHATANAIDISGFRLADGRLISVLNDWDKKTPEGKYLRAVHKQACHLFSVTLGPDYNAAHADHFHLDFGSGSACR